MAHFQIPFIFAGSRDAGQEVAKRFIFTAYKAAWQRSERFRKAGNVTTSDPNAKA